MVVNFILQAVLIFVLLALWAGCGAFWTKYIVDNNGIPLTKANLFAVYMVSPILSFFFIVYSTPFKILNWILDLKEEVKI